MLSTSRIRSLGCLAVNLAKRLRVLPYELCELERLGVVRGGDEVMLTAKLPMDHLSKQRKSKRGSPPPCLLPGKKTGLPAVAELGW